MTYEEKLQKVVSKLKSERELTRKGYKTKVRFDDKSFTKVRIQDICKILLKLQDDENALSILEAFLPTDPHDPYDGQKSDNYDRVSIIDVEFGEEFDLWYAEHIMQQKSKPVNLDWFNLLKIADVSSDIDQRLQLNRSTTVVIPSFPYPYIGRFVDLFPVDTQATRKSYQQHRYEGAEYLLQEGIALDVKYVNDDLLSYGEIVIKIDLVKFDDFFKLIMDEYKSRKPTHTHETVQKADGEAVKKVSKLNNMDEIVYQIIYTPQRQILMNNVQFAKPDFNSENDLVFSYLYEHPNESVSKDKLEVAIGDKLTKSLHKIVENLGFEGDLKEVFISVSKKAIQFRNPITRKDLESMKKPTLKLFKGGAKLLLPH